ncbi:MAG: GGDEF domain-containing protein [Actinomycetota bacterium]|nr:GGDEF domain-containing protein [Actinomycetota bacterium]
MAMLGPFAGGELGLITRDVASRVGAQTGVLAVFNQGERLVQVVCAWGTAPWDSHLLSLPADGFVGRVLESGHAAVEPINPEHDPGLGIPRSAARLSYAAGAAVRPPGGQPGALCAGFAAAPQDRELTIWLLEGYARLAALCLHDAGILDGLLAATRIDGLTGCLKHTTIRAELERQIGRCERHGGPVSCCFIDLDHFKQIDDRHGHPCGNQVLADVAAVLREAMRAGDTLGRYDGDEFVAILPDTDQAAACVLAERLRSMIATTTPDGASEPLDASVGVAQWQPRQKADELLAAADQALLAAKADGGGTVARADDVAAGASRDGAVGANGEIAPGRLPRARSPTATPAVTP